MWFTLFSRANALSKNGLALSRYGSASQSFLTIDQCSGLCSLGLAVLST